MEVTQVPKTLKNIDTSEDTRVKTFTLKTLHQSKCIINTTGISIVSLTAVSIQCF